MTVTSLFPRVNAAVGKRLRRVSKHVYQNARWRSLNSPKVLFIVGCQRSGTTLMTRLFDADLNCRVFGEFSELSSADKVSGIRLNPLPEVAAVIKRTPAPLVVAKPLVETQNIAALLDYFPGSKSIFMYRGYLPVAKSDVAKFGARNAIENLRPIVEGDPDNWRSAGVGRETRALVSRFYSRDMNPHDAAALFWLTRNQVFFDLDLPSHGSVMLLKYEHLTEEPTRLMQRVYDFVSLPCPELSQTAEVHSASVGKGADLNLSPPIRIHCDELLAKLDAHCDPSTAGSGSCARQGALS